jgi:hypothetical protein
LDSPHHHVSSRTGGHGSNAPWPGAINHHHTNSHGVSQERSRYHQSVV